MRSNLFISILIIFFLITSYSYGAEPGDAQIALSLQREIAPEAGEMVYFLKSGDKLKGTTLEDGADYVKIKQVFGYSGFMVTRLNKADILQTEAVSTAVADITGQEIRIKKELPSFHFSRSGVYSFFTDQDYFKINKSVELLQRLYGGFLATFAPLIDKALTRRNYVIIFRKPEDYDSYKQKIAPYLKNAAGFYDVANNELVFYDFFNSQDYAEIDNFVKQQNQKIRDLRSENLRYKDSNYDVYQDNVKVIRGYEESLSAYSSRAASQTRDVNVRILRHEASHQLSFDLMLSGNAENFDTWLLEGLAEYCSTPSIGEKNPEYIKFFRDALKGGSAIPLRELFSYSKDNKFYALEGDKLGLAYAQSWALFYFLMQPQWRNVFFEYWGKLKAAPEVMGLDDRIKLAQENLGISLDELQKQLDEFVIAK